MKKNVNSIRPIDLKYLASMDIYDILNNEELKWLLTSNIDEERIIATQLLRDRRINLHESNWNESLIGLMN
jgi:hypothetical protein